jgi:hypothetical protein
LSQRLSLAFVVIKELIFLSNFNIVDLAFIHKANVYSIVSLSAHHHFSHLSLFINQSRLILVTTTNLVVTPFGGYD